MVEDFWFTEDIIKAQLVRVRRKRFDSVINCTRRYGPSYGPSERFHVVGVIWDMVRHGEIEFDPKDQNYLRLVR